MVPYSLQAKLLLLPPKPTTLNLPLSIQMVPSIMIDFVKISRNHNLFLLFYLILYPSLLYPLSINPTLSIISHMCDSLKPPAFVLEAWLMHFSWFIGLEMSGIQYINVLHNILPLSHILVIPLKKCHASSFFFFLL